MSKTQNMLSFFSLIGKLKHTKRTGWLRHKVNDPECISAHMYRMSIMAMTLCDDHLNKDHCIKMCLVHDMAECIVGDITPSDGVPDKEKYEEEVAAMDQLGGFLRNDNAESLKQLFIEYEEQKTPESHFVKDLDKFDMILQAYEYEKRANKPRWLQEFFDSTEGVFKTKAIQNLVESLKVRRSEHHSAD